jgi:uncharacterized protein with FMN-binding domain
VSSKKRVTNNLVVMGSAAVVAVYAAGFVRTAAAAEKFTEMSNERGPLLTKAKAGAAADVPVAMTSRKERAEASGANDTSGARTETTAALSAAAAGNVAVSSAPHAATNAAEIAATNATVTAASNKVVAPTTQRSTAEPRNLTQAVASLPAKSDASAARVTAQPIAVAAVGKPAPAPVRVAPTAAVSAPTAAATPAAAPAPVPVATSTLVAQPSPTSAAPADAAEKPVAASTPIAAAQVAVAPAAKAPLPPGVKYRDGEYYGWGTSRHGDIQAYVEVTDGKVSFVKIAQCLTQYSCGVIDVLPGQVFTRNSPDVDAVSGATQSSNAFYFAVQQALGKAK